MNRENSGKNTTNKNLQFACENRLTQIQQTTKKDNVNNRHFIPMQLLFGIKGFYFLYIHVVCTPIYWGKKRKDSAFKYMFSLPWPTLHSNHSGIEKMKFNYLKF